jgi:hypothetical protein
MFRSRAMAQGLSTAPADRARAEDAFARAYRSIGAWPVPVIWAEGPGQVPGILKARVCQGGRIGAPLWDHLRQDLKGQLQDHLLHHLGPDVAHQLRARLRTPLWDQLGDKLGNQLWERLHKPAYTPWWGQQDIYWFAAFDFAAWLGARYPKDVANRLDIQREISASCMWWYPRDGVIVACERPARVERDAEGRLHSEIGAAVLFRDGLELHVLHGAQAPAWAPSKVATAV